MILRILFKGLICYGFITYIVLSTTELIYVHLNIHAHAVDVLVKNVYFQSPNFRSVACLMYDLNCSVAKRWNKLTLERHTTIEHPYSFYTDNFVFYYWSISLFHGRPFHGLLFIYCKMVYNILCEILLWWYFYVRYSSYLLGSVIERQRDRMGYWHKRKVSSSSPPSLPPNIDMKNYLNSS